MVAFTTFLVPKVSSISGTRNWLKLSGILTLGHLQEKLLISRKNKSWFQQSSESPRVVAWGVQGPLPLGVSAVSQSPLLGASGG